MWQMRWNLRGTLVALLTVVAVAACLTIASWIARRDKERIPSARRAIRNLREPVMLDRGSVTYSLELPQDGLELRPVSTGDLYFDLATLGSDLRWQNDDKPWQPPRVPPRTPGVSIGCLDFDWEAWLWQYKFPSGDLILNPEALDSVRPPN
jgi:hypothetical protein